jgi:hypothetical protein
MARESRKPGQAITGMDIGGEIARTLGLPLGTNLIQICIGLDEAVEVICRYFPDAEAAERLLQVFRRYRVVPADEVGISMTPGESFRMPIQHTQER